MKNKKILIGVAVILSIICAISIKNNIQRAKLEEIRLKNEAEERTKEDNIKKYVDYIRSKIGEQDKVTYDKSSNKVYITVYCAAIDNMGQLADTYYNSNDEDKIKIKDSIGWDTLQKDNMNLYTNLKDNQKNYEIDLGIRIMVNNSIKSESISPNILMIDNGTITDMLYKEKKENTTTTTKQTYKARFGDFLECNINGSTAVVKFKIEPSTSNKTTIDQNGYNIEDMILNQGADKYDEIQYWAVADMTDGSESKVISFTVDKDLISMIKNKQIVGNQIVDYGKDLWILPSLK